MSGQPPAGLLIMIRKETQTFPGRYDQVKYICRFVTAGAEQAGIDEDTRFQIELACDEACTNVIEHTYTGEKVGDLTVTWELDDQAFRVTVWDSGDPFDPRTVETPELPPRLDVDSIPVGGLGMLFIRRLMDEIRYRYDEGNQLTLVKWLPAPPHLAIWQRALGGNIQLVGVRGRLDQNLTPRLEQALLNLLGETRPRLIVDLSESTYINSVGLRTLVTAWRRARQQGGDLVLCGLQGRLAEIFEMIGFDKLFRLFPTWQAAYTSLISV